MNKAFFLAILMVACGGSSDSNTTAAAGTEHSAGGEHEGQKHEGGEHSAKGHPALPAGLQAYHDVFAPIWHSEASAERVTTACAATPELMSLAPATEGKPPEEEKESTLCIGKATKALVKACEEPTNQEGVDGALKTVHDTFHESMERAAAPTE